MAYFFTKQPFSFIVYYRPCSNFNYYNIYIYILKTYSNLFLAILSKYCPVNLIHYYLHWYNFYGLIFLTDNDLMGWCSEQTCVSTTIRVVGRNFSFNVPKIAAIHGLFLLLPSTSIPLTLHIIYFLAWFCMNYTNDHPRFSLGYIFAH